MFLISGLIAIAVVFLLTRVGGVRFSGGNDSSKLGIGIMAYLVGIFSTTTFSFKFVFFSPIKFMK